MADVKIKSEFFDSWIWNKPRKFSEAEAVLFLLTSDECSLRFLSRKFGWSFNKVKLFIERVDLSEYAKKGTAKGTAKGTDNKKKNSELSDSTVQQKGQQKEQFYEEEIKLFNTFNEWLKSKCKYVPKIEKQLTIKQFIMLNETCKTHDVKLSDIILDLENFKKNGKTCDKAYTDLNRTLNKWIKH